MKGFKNIISVLGMLFIVIGCAKRGSITGGDKDIIPPKLLKSEPKNLITNFNQNTIKLYFDEFVKIKDIQKNLIVSPLLKYPLTINPQGGVSKVFTLKINDTLIANSTYCLNFGESIIDNNEGNPLKNFKYVFSTGDKIDSLTVEGIIKDSYDKKTEKFVNVMLYEFDEKFNDSTIYKKTPRYITNTLDSLTSFKIENVKAGKYKLIALKEKTNNYKFDPKKDKIGFYNQTITVPDKSIFELELFKEEPKFETKKPIQVSSNRILLGYQGNIKNTEIKALKENQDFEIKKSKVKDTDSLHIWIKPLEKDSILLNVKNGDYQKNNVVHFKKMKQDTLNISPLVKSILKPKQHIQFNTFTPLTTLNKEKIKLFKKDSTEIKYNINYDEFNQIFDLVFDTEPNEKYSVFMEEGSIVDYLGNKNKKAKYIFNTKNIADYGNLKLNLQNVKSFPIIIELTDEKGKILESKYSEKATEIEFLLIEPQKYSLRIIYDTNKNGQRDTGSYLENRQPEEVFHFSNEIDVRANWDVNQDVDLGK